MKKQGKLLLKHRRYSKTFKKSIVQDFESGRFSVQQLSNLHGMSIQSIYNWIYKYSHVNQRGTRIMEYSDSSEEKLRQLERKIADLERRLGQKQIELELFQKLIEIASEELQIDLKKLSPLHPLVVPRPPGND
jgi:transposase